MGLKRSGNKTVESGRISQTGGGGTSATWKKFPLYPLFSQRTASFIQVFDQSVVRSGGAQFRQTQTWPRFDSPTWHRSETSGKGRSFVGVFGLAYTVHSRSKQHFDQRIWRQLVRQKSPTMQWCQCYGWFRHQWHQGRGGTRDKGKSSSPASSRLDP